MTNPISYVIINYKLRKQRRDTMNNEAYLYEILVKSTGKKYIGWHAKPFDGTYLHSSECPIFLKDFAKNDNDYNIIDTGTKTEMATKEHMMLMEVDAKNNPDYYNKSNGGGIYVKKTNYKNVIELWQDVMNKKFPVNLVKKETIKDILRFQVRVLNTDPEHLKVLIDAMRDLHGDLTKWEPVHVLEGYSKDGDDVLINGNHTTISANKVPFVLEVPVMYIPKSVWSKFSEAELIDLANLLNPQPEKAAKPSDKEDWVANIVKKYNEKGIAADSEENKTLLKTNNWSTRQVNDIIKKAKTKIELNDKLPAGWQWKNWKLYKNELDMIVENATDKDSIAMAMSSGKFNFALLQDKLKALLKAKSKKTHMTVYITHPNWNAMQEWKKKHLAEHIDNVETWIAPKGFIVEFVELDYKVKNSLEDI